MLVLGNYTIRTRQMIRQRLLVSVRGKNDALEAIKGGAQIIDAEYPGSALGTCWPANILAISNHTPAGLQVSTNNDF